MGDLRACAELPFHLRETREEAAAKDGIPVPPDDSKAELVQIQVAVA